jgi:hypothetical protein
MKAVNLKKASAATLPFDFAQGKLASRLYRDRQGDSNRTAAFGK